MRVINNNIIDFEEEGLVGIVVSHQQAAMLMHMLDHLHVGDKLSDGLFSGLREQPEVVELYEEIVDKVDGEDVLNYSELMGWTA